MIIGLFSFSYQAQTQNNLSISEIQRYLKIVDDLNKVTSIVVKTENDGNRWIYFTWSELELGGDPNDNKYLGLMASATEIKFLFNVINIYLEKPISLEDLQQILLSKGINGVRFLAKNEEYYFKCSQIFEVIKTDEFLNKL